MRGLGQVVEYNEASRARWQQVGLRTLVRHPLEHHTVQPCLPTRILVFPDGEQYGFGPIPDAQHPVRCRPFMHAELGSRLGGDGVSRFEEEAERPGLARRPDRDAMSTGPEPVHLVSVARRDLHRPSSQDVADRAIDRCLNAASIEHHVRTATAIERHGLAPVEGVHEIVRTEHV